MRTENLKAQASLANLLAENVDLSTQPWNQLVQMMAEFWVSRGGEHVHAKDRRLGGRRQKFVAPEDMLADRAGRQMGRRRFPPASATAST